MKRFIFLAILCSLALGMGAQTAKEEIFADVHRSAANYYAYPVPSVEQTAPPAGYKPFYLSHYARHGSRFLINPDDYEKPLAVMREADGNGVLTELGKRRFAFWTVSPVSPKTDMVSLPPWERASIGGLPGGCIRTFRRYSRGRLRWMRVPQSSSAVSFRWWRNVWNFSL